MHKLSTLNLKCYLINVTESFTGRVALPAKKRFHFHYNFRFHITNCVHHFRTELVQSILVVTELIHRSPLLWMKVLLTKHLGRHWTDTPIAAPNRKEKIWGIISEWRSTIKIIISYISRHWFQKPGICQIKLLFLYLLPKDALLLLNPNNHWPSQKIPGICRLRPKHVLGYLGKV